ncbi:uncharacterized protein [Drosophila takahashii]|uniref:uncharacterized protein n=1 Tax=Drosophila takahashii TaxID=29030 RepID=UPI001CF80F28|nr:uncharacterized protein LOC108059023 [Drosophila takahashii]
MAEKKAEDRPSRMVAQNRQQEQNNALFAQLFASLEGEHRKLRELEQRRSKLIEEMKNLRALLFAENQKLRQTVAPVPGSNSISIPERSSTVVPSLAPQSSVRLERKASSKSVTIVEPPAKSLNITERPRASSSQSLQKKGNRRNPRASSSKTKRRKAFDIISNTREDMLNEIGESELSTSLGANLQTLEQHRSDLEDRQDIDEVLVSLPELFTLMDSRFADTNSAISPNNPVTDASPSLLNSDQDPSFYLPSAGSLFEDLLEADSARLMLDLPEVSLELPSVGIAECSANVAEISESEPENKTG